MSSSFGIPETSIKHSDIVIEGAQRVREQVIRDIIKSLYRGTDSHDGHKVAALAEAELLGLGVFKYVRVHYREPFLPYSRGGVTVRCKEAPRLMMQPAVSIGFNTESEAPVQGSVSATVRNATGLADTVEVSYKSGLHVTADMDRSVPQSGKLATTTEHQFMARYTTIPGFLTKFTGPRPLPKMDVTAWHSMVPLGGMLGSPMREHGSRIQLRLHEPRKWNVSTANFTTYSLDCSKRKVEHDLRGRVAPEVEHWSVQGPALHVAAAVEAISDTRDKTVFPTKGVYFQRLAEIGTTSYGHNLSDLANGFFAKLTCEARKAKTTSTRIGSFTQATTFKGGYLFSTNASHISDRFFLGGPMDIRGETMQGMGPRIHKTRLGGVAFWAFGHSLLTQRLTPPSWPVDGRLQGFVNAGALAPDAAGTKVPTLYSLWAGTHINAGVGLAVGISDQLRLEMNYVLPVVRMDGPRRKGRFQFGIGLSFL